MAPDIHVSRRLKATFGLVLLATILIGLEKIVGATGRAEGRPDITDFHTFYLVGQLIRAGHFAQAYQGPAMLALEQALGGRPVFMPWSYPPLFGLVVAALAALPLGVAFVLFAGTTLGLYVWTMGRLDAEGRWPVMLASTVSIVLNLRCGQNGLLTAGIVAGAMSCLLGAKPARAGVCLAAMAFKPHLVSLLPVVLLLEKRWTALAASAFGALALTGLSLWIFGPTVFAAFLGALPEVGRLMALGAYPLHRMTSIYAFGIGLGLPSWGAMLLHGTVAISVLAAAGRPALRWPDPRLRLGLAIMAGFFISPYVYDYDLVVFGVGLLLVTPALRNRVSARGYGLILAGCATAQSLGLMMSSFVARYPDITFSPMGPAILIVFGCILRPLWNESLSSAEAPVAA